MGLECGRQVVGIDRLVEFFQGSSAHRLSPVAIEGARAESWLRHRRAQGPTGQSSCHDMGAGMGAMAVTETRQANMAWHEPGLGQVFVTRNRCLPATVVLASGIVITVLQVLPASGEIETLQLGPLASNFTPDLPVL